MRYAIENKTGKKVLEFQTGHGMADAFLSSYGLIIDDCLEMKKRKKVNFLEYLSEKLKDPYLNNLLKEMDFNFNEKEMTVTENKIFNR